VGLRENGKQEDVLVGERGRNEEENKATPTPH